MRILLASTITAFLVAGCGNGDMPTQLDGGNVPPDLSSNTPPDLSTDGPNPDLAPAPCDAIKQDCTDPNKSKCTFVDDGTATNMYIPICVMPTGTQMTDDTCTRLNDMASGVGYDDCAKGNLCTTAGSLSKPPVRHCRSFCFSDSECQNGDICIGGALNKDMTAFIIGLCVPVCTEFGTDCPQGYNCSELLPQVDAMDVRLACRQPGTVPNGGPCKSDLDCVPDAICIIPKKGAGYTCSALCDMTNHPCSNGQLCARYLQDVMTSTVFACVTP